MNEADTRAELIEPALKNSGWGVTPKTRILREYTISTGRVEKGRRPVPVYADFILQFKGINLAVVEAKSEEISYAEGVAQTKNYAELLSLPFAYATNGRQIYFIDRKTHEERLVEKFHTPQELWEKAFAKENIWRDKFGEVPFEDKSGTWQPRYYQEIAIQRTMEAIAEEKSRILLTLATGTGKTAIAFQIAWKLFHSRWTLQRDSKRRPRILFLADRNILADQAFNSFSAFLKDSMIRVKPSDIRKAGRVPMNGSIFFTIFQTFLSGGSDEETDDDAPEMEVQGYFGDYPPDFFDLIFIDECHRGGANDESTWRVILEYFSPAVQIGLTATPKRTVNIDTYHYFGDPIYEYSLKQGINDGFLTPFKVKAFTTDLDEYTYTGDDEVQEGLVEHDKTYTEKDFNRKIQIREREELRVKLFMSNSNLDDKALIFCSTQKHAAMIRDIINQLKPKSKNENYCVRVTADDGVLGEQHLRDFQDNEKTIPIILTTSKKLSTGVDARNVRNIVLLRPIKQMIEFKQIIGRGTRLFEGKYYFTIYDFVKAHEKFEDKEWDGPIERVVCKKCGQFPCICEAKPCPKCGQIPCVCPPKDDPPKVCEVCGQDPCICKNMVKIRLKDGKIYEINHTLQVSFWSKLGKPMTVQEFIEELYGELPKLCRDEAELRKIWSMPKTRQAFLKRLEQAGYTSEQLSNLRRVIDAEDSDLFDVLDYIFNSDRKPISRRERVEIAYTPIFAFLNEKQKDFIDFVLKKYITHGIGELDLEHLANLLKSKYGTVNDATKFLGPAKEIKQVYIDFQKYLYKEEAESLRV